MKTIRYHLLRNDSVLKPRRSRLHASLSCLVFLWTMSLGLCSTYQTAFAQGVGISESAITLDPSAILEARSTAKGLLAPRMTTAERDAISSPATGLMIFNTSTGEFNFYTGTAWTAVDQPGLDYLGSTTLGGAAATTGAVTIAARDMLLIVVRVTGYGGGDIIGLRFNGDAGANYWDRHMHAAAGGTTWTNTENASTTLIRLAGNNSTQARTIVVTISNRAATSKSCTIQTQTNTTSAATVGRIDIGGGQWFNTASQITSVELRTAGGNTMNAGTSFVVFGKNF